jgi:cbb3-type cytochrome oxidase cytochrome c subunit
MNFGPLLFLAAFFALAGSWFGLVLKPQIQLGRLQQTNSIPSGPAYPVARPGLAREGLDVYRANGCAYCHSQQVGQTSTTCEVVLTDPGTNQPALLAALLKVNPALSETEAKQALATLPKLLLPNATREAAEAAVKALNVGGAKAQLRIVPQGPDLARGWGRRRTVAEDYLYDYPLMLGSQRIGPDLANVGTRQPDANRHLLHLYDPSVENRGSLMPQYRFLFERRRIEHGPSPDALVLPPALAPKPGYEIVPKPAAKALVAYLLSLHADASLFDAPFTVAAETTSKAAPTNAPVK